MNGTLITRVASLCALPFFYVTQSDAQPSGQQLPDTLWLPAILYDFHADGSNPEFEVSDMNVGLVTGMVEEDAMEYKNENADYFGLNSIAKPVLGGDPFFSNYVHKWFRPWQPGDFTKPRYNSPMGTLAAVETVNHDTAFVNKVFKDSLPFVHLGNGVYQFSRTGSGESQFFWLDGKGYGNEPVGWDHNFAFTMELHHEFTYESGLTFDFNGDDDVWVFVNGHLAMDLGGRHAALSGSFNVDDIAAQAGMEVGKKYMFDFFYAERHTGASTIKITTNILMPASLELKVLADTIEAGSIEDAVRAVVRNSDGVAVDEYANRVEWRLIGDVQPGDTLANEEGEFAAVGATLAFRTVKIQGHFSDKTSTYSYTLYDTVEVYVKPGAPYAVFIESWSDSPFSDSEAAPQTFEDSTKADAIAGMRLGRGEDTLYACAVTRDRFGNYTGLASGAAWTTVPSPTVVRARPWVGGKWQAVIARTAPDSATVEIAVSQDGLMPDTVPLVVGLFDTEGPKITRALYFLGSLPYERGEMKPDTLVVIFDEPVLCEQLLDARSDPYSVFEYSGIESGEVVFDGAYFSDADMEACEDSMTQVSVILSNPRKVHPIEDSMGISDGKLLDRHGNAAPVDGPKKPIEWGRAYDWVLSCSPNPFNPISDILPVQVMDMIDSRGEPLPEYAAIIEIAAVTPVDIDDSWATMYDAVGNVVQQQLPVYRNRVDPFRYEILWDGHNRNGRLVGAGTYLAVVSLQGTDGGKQTVKRTRIGVKR